MTKYYPEGDKLDAAASVVGYGVAQSAGRRC